MAVEDNDVYNVAACIYGITHMQGQAITARQGRDGLGSLRTIFLGKGPHQLGALGKYCKQNRNSPKLIQEKFLVDTQVH